MRVDDVVGAIARLNEKRFVVTRSGEAVDSIIAVGEEELERAVCQVRREGADGHRTVLVASGDEEQLALANRWVAEVRDRLREPLTADLFLFFISERIPVEVAMRYESEELYCRRFVSRPEETPDEPVYRSSLAPVGSAEQATPLEEPLAASLRQIAEEADWMTDSVQERWRTVLLSGVDGGTQADQLIAALGEENT